MCITIYFERKESRKALAHNVLRVNDMKKHAYLIMIHEYTYVLQCLLESIDDDRNSIYIHIDGKAESDIEQKIRLVLVHSELIFVPCVHVNWGGYSMIRAEMNLLRAATSRGSYQYYHLLSGADLPLKTQDEIYEYFLNNSGLEFIDFQNKEFSFSDRIKYYYFFQDYISRNNISYKYKILIKLQSIFISVQKAICVNRNHDVMYQKGANWFSITDEFARLIVSKESWVRKKFRWTYCADELLIQTIYVNFAKDRFLYMNGFDYSCKSNLRLIDWERGTPYVFKNSDYDMLINSGMLFARKFSDAYDDVIVKRIAARVNNKKSEC